MLHLKNWITYQHYKDRHPVWVKLHCNITASNEWVFGDDRLRLAMIACIIAAARNDNNIPSAEYIRRTTLVDVDDATIDRLIESGYLCRDDASADASKHASKHASADASADASSMCTHTATHTATDIATDTATDIARERREEERREETTLDRSCDRSAMSDNDIARSQDHACTADAVVDAIVDDKNDAPRKRTRRSTQYPEQFEAFWTAYPRRIGKHAAWRAWQRLAPDADIISAIMTAVDAQKRSEQWTRDNGRYIPHPATWLNQRRWLDDVDPVSNDESKNWWR